MVYLEHFQDSTHELKYPFHLKMATGLKKACSTSFSSGSSNAPKSFSSSLTWAKVTNYEPAVRAEIKSVPMKEKKANWLTKGNELLPLTS